MSINAKPKLLYDNTLAATTGTLVAGSTDSGTQYDVDNVIDLRTLSHWKAANSSDNFIERHTISPSVPANAIGIVGHNLGTIGALVRILRRTLSMSYDWCKCEALPDPEIRSAP